MKLLEILLTWSVIKMSFGLTGGGKFNSTFYIDPTKEKSFLES
jgi:hypothetical protein